MNYPHDRKIITTRFVLQWSGILNVMETILSRI